MAIQMVPGRRAIKTLDALFLFKVKPEVSSPEKSGFYNERFHAFDIFVIAQFLERKICNPLDYVADRLKKLRGSCQC